MEERVILFKNKCKMYYQEALSAMLRDTTLTSIQVKEVSFSIVSEVMKLRQYGWMVKALDLALGC